MPVSAREYHERTKHTPERVRADTHRLHWENQPIPYKIYEDLPSVPLPDDFPTLEARALQTIARSAGKVERATTDRLAPDVADVDRLCRLSSGITKVLDLGGREHAFRAAACTGALYHVDCYLVAADLPGSDASSDAGLDAGVYHFDPRKPALDVLREGDYRGVVAQATGDHPAVAGAPLSIVLTSTWWRNAWKYRERTYRHAFWDSGTILANLLAVAHALDLPASIVTGFADGAMADLLAVETRNEGPVAVIPVGAGDPSPGSRPVEPVDPETRPLSPDPVEYGLIRDAYEASSLADGDAVRGWRESVADGTAGPSIARGPGDGGRVQLDPVTDERAAGTPLHVTVRRRGSCREYARDPLSFRKVSTVLDRATRGVPIDGLPSNAPLALNDCYLVVNGVEGVDPGAYHFHPGEAGGAADVAVDDNAPFLERLRSGDFRREAGHLALDQRLAADAALCAFFLTDLDAVTDRLGDRGYRVAQLEAAITAGRLYLGAYAHRGLGATGLTFYDDEVTEFFTPRTAGQTPTFLWTLGRPA